MYAAIALMTISIVIAVWAVALWIDTPAGRQDGGVDQVFDA
jgi:hypothetical protein